MEDSIIRTIWNAYGMLEMDDDGNSMDPNITCKIEWMWYPRPWDNNEGNFTFDWRLDPWDVAEELDKCLDAILAHGYEKVNIVGLSGSGPILLAYLERYGTDKLASAMFNISLHGGTSLMGDMATKKLGVNPQALGYTSPLAITVSEIPGVPFDPLAPLLRFLYEIGLIDVIGKMVNLGISWSIDRIYEEAVIPLFFRMPAMWCQIPPDQYEQAKELLLKGDPKYAGLVRKIDRYHYDIMANQNEIIRAAASKIKVAVRTGYGLPFYGITESACGNSDDYVDAEYASFGAACAPLDQPFPASYTQQVPGEQNYISPDRLIDASTCALPSLTWLTKGQPHRGESSFGGWYEWFLAAEGDYGVFANPDYPQYSEYIRQFEYETLEYTPRSPILEVLIAAGLWFMKVWRFIVLLPMAWMDIPLFSTMVRWLQTNGIL